MIQCSAGSVAVCEGIVVELYTALFSTPPLFALMYVHKQYAWPVWAFDNFYPIQPLLCV